MKASNNARGTMLRLAAIALLAGAAACQQVNTTSNASQPAAAAPAAPGAAAAAAPQNGAKPAGPATAEAAKPASVAAAAPAPAPAPAAAPDGEEQAIADRNVRIVNQTGQTITYLKGSPSNDSDWGADRIPTSVLAAGDSVMIDFDDGNGECVYDLQATLADGSVRVSARANVCRISEWTVPASE